MKKRNWITAIFASLAAVCLSFGFWTVEKAQPVSVSADTSATESPIQMLKGAGARLSETQGLRFSATVTQEQVKAWDETNTVECGMLIMPYDYVAKYGDLTEANVFGGEAVYTWNKKEGAGSTKILNLVTKSSALHTDGNNYVVKGSIVNIMEKNIERQFTARAYAKLTADADGTVTYVMSDYYEDDVTNNSRSIFYVSNHAYEDFLNGVGTQYNEAQQIWLENTMVTAIGNRYKAFDEVDSYGEDAFDADTYDAAWFGLYDLCNSLESQVYLKLMKQIESDSGFIFKNPLDTASQLRDPVQFNISTENAKANAVYSAREDAETTMTGPKEVALCDLSTASSWANSVSLQPYGVSIGAPTKPNGMVHVEFVAASAKALGFSSSTNKTAVIDGYTINMTGATYVDPTAAVGEGALFLPEIKFYEYSHVKMHFVLGEGVTHVSLVQDGAIPVTGAFTIELVYKAEAEELTGKLIQNGEILQTTNHYGGYAIMGTGSVVLWYSSEAGKDANIHFSDPLYQTTAYYEIDKDFINEYVGYPSGTADKDSLYLLSTVESGMTNEGYVRYFGDQDDVHTDDVVALRVSTDAMNTIPEPITSLSGALSSSSLVTFTKETVTHTTSDEKVYTYDGASISTDTNMITRVFLPLIDFTQTTQVILPLKTSSAGLAITGKSPIEGTKDVMCWITYMYNAETGVVVATLAPIEGNALQTVTIQDKDVIEGRRSVSFCAWGGATGSSLFFGQVSAFSYKAIPEFEELEQADGTLVPVERTLITLPDKQVVYNAAEKKYELNLNISAIEYEITKVTVNGTDYTSRMVDNEIAFEESELPGDEGTKYEVFVSTEGRGFTDYKLSLVLNKATRLNHLNAGTAESFKAILSNNPNGSFILEEDLDFATANLAGAIEFAGVLNGQGYHLKNFTLALNSEAEGYNSYVFKSNSGTIKDIGFEYTMTELNNNKGALILTNTGTIENVYVDCTLAWSTPSEWYQVGSLTHTNNGMMKNVFAKLTLKEGVTIAAGHDSTYTVGVVTAYNNGAGVMENVYAVEPTTYPGLGYAMFPWATQTECKAYADMKTMVAEVKSLDPREGWCDHWNIVEEVVSHGSENEGVTKYIELDAPATLYVQNGVYTVILPDLAENVKSVTIDGEEYEFTANADGYAQIVIGDTALTEKEHRVAYSMKDGAYSFAYTLTTKWAKGELTPITTYLQGGSHYVVDLSEVDGEVTEVMKDGTVKGAIDPEDNTKWIIQKGELLDGTDNLVVVAGGYNYLLALTTYEVAVLNQSNARTLADFIAMINATPGADFTLACDLDFGGAELANANGINTFSGVLDGNGYSIRNFAIQFGVNWETNLIISNSGTIKNIGLEYSISLCNSDFTSLIKKNEATGVVENVYAKVTINASDQRSGMLVGNNMGTVANCIVEMTVAQSDASLANLGIITGYNQNVLKNSYAICASDCNITKNGAASNCMKYDSMAALIAAEVSLLPGDGWSLYWLIDNGELTFNNGNANALRKVTLEKQTVGLTDGNYVIDLTAADAANITSLTVGGVDMLSSISGNSLTIAEADLPEGEYTLIAETADTQYTFTVVAAGNVIVLNETNAGTLANFIAKINATPDGNFMLVEDLDFDGDISGQVIQSFTGTLDGKGYSIKNFEIKYGGTEYKSVLFENNSGTIKNLGVEYTLGTANSSNVGLIERNDGTIENLFVKVNFKAYQWTTGAIAAINGGTGIVRNCIVVMETTLTDQAAKNRLGTIVGVDYNGKLLNNYAIVNGIHTLTTPYVDTWNYGTYTNNVNYADMEAMTTEVTALPAEDGWSEYWSIANGGVTFGN